MSDLRLRAAERYQDQARTDREAVRAGFATPAQRYRDAVREGRRRPWTLEQKLMAANILSQPKQPDREVSGREFTDAGSVHAYESAVKAVFRRTHRDKSFDADHYRGYSDPRHWRPLQQRFRAWAERVVEETS